MRRWFQPPAAAPAAPRTVALEGERVPIDLSHQFNSETIRSWNRWYYAPLPVEIGPHIVERDGRPTLTVGDMTFVVTNAKTNLAVIEVGTLDNDTGVLAISDKPKRMTWPVALADIGWGLFVGAAMAGAAHLVLTSRWANRSSR